MISLQHGDLCGNKQKLIGIRIMQRRKALKMTQEELAEQVGLSKNHLSNIERGVYLPTTQLVLRLCAVLGETPDFYLIGKITTETDEISSLIKRLPENSQKVVCRLIETYLDTCKE